MMDGYSALLGPNLKHPSSISITTHSKARSPRPIRLATKQASKHAAPCAARGPVGDGAGRGGGARPRRQGGAAGLRSVRACDERWEGADGSMLDAGWSMNGGIGRLSSP